MVIGNRFVGFAPTAAFKGKIGPQNWYFRNFYCTHTVLSNENPAGNRGLSVSPGFPRFWAHLPIHPLRHFSIQSDARLVVDEAADSSRTRIGGMVAFPVTPEIRSSAFPQLVIQGTLQKRTTPWVMGARVTHRLLWRRSMKRRVSVLEALASVVVPEKFDLGCWMPKIRISKILF